MFIPYRLIGQNYSLMNGYSPWTLLEIQIQNCKLHGLGTLGPRNITVITSYELWLWKYLFIITYDYCSRSTSWCYHCYLSILHQSEAIAAAQLAIPGRRSAPLGATAESGGLREVGVWELVHCGALQHEQHEIMEKSWTTKFANIYGKFIMFYHVLSVTTFTKLYHCTWSWISCSCSSQSPHLSMGALTIPVCWNHVLFPNSKNNQDLQWFLDISCVSFTEVWNWSSGTVPNLRHARCHCQLASKQWSAQQFRCLAKLEKQHRQNVNSWSAKTKKGKTVERCWTSSITKNHC